MSANEEQVGGSHYKKGGEEHWDRAWRLKYDPFQYIITKWIERWRDKGGLQDLYKARHAIQKYIEVLENEKRQAELRAKRNLETAGITLSNPLCDPIDEGAGPCRGYVDQDSRC